MPHLASAPRTQPPLRIVIADDRAPTRGALRGITATTLIKTRWPTVRVIVHSLAIEWREKALAAGADAFVPKGGRPDALLNALGAS